MAPLAHSSLPRLNTLPVPPTPGLTSAPAGTSTHPIFDPNQTIVQSPSTSQRYSQTTSPTHQTPFSPGSRQTPRSESGSKWSSSNVIGNGESSKSPRSILLSPSNKSPTSRPLSPDLPNRDALYLFCNFSSYMRSPNEGGQGVKADDFKDTVRLLEHARWLTSQSHSNVHILHLKYRFQGQTSAFRSPYSTGDYQLPLNYKGSIGRVRNPVPQPFSVLHDPVVKIDYMENGIFDPLPAQAVFSHIAKMCQPPPRIIVISYVYSKVIENHLSSLSTWASTSSPPSYVFSPVETRLREPQPLHVALGHAIPMSMYAWPSELYNSLSPLPSASGTTNGPHNPLSPLGGYRYPISPRHSITKMNNQGRENDEQSEEHSLSPLLLTRRISGAESPNDMIDRYYARLHGNKYTSDPIASLTIITSSPPTITKPLPLPPLKDNGTDQSATEPTVGPQNELEKLKSNEISPSTVHAQMQVPVDRIPLWHLAPGVGVLHGSTSASIGVKLSDFSAINLVGDNGKIRQNDAKKNFRSSDMEGLGIRTTPFDLNDIENKNLSLMDIPMPISRPSSTTPASIGILGRFENEKENAKKEIATKMIHLTPPDPKPKSLTSNRILPASQSWPAPVSRVPGWRKGRKEMMEDTLEEMGLGQFTVGSDRVGLENVERDVGAVVINGQQQEIHQAERGKMNLIEYLLKKDDPK
ncbi:uncharacterized protein IL334_006533 [Kwoniella shivajii]|uniref:Uncharacterized protein n=1 Tax=Kwoniella shivajii TaxID=564305 RepID=A0ABZ1D999_9TREE|nr:hypothetical protein IL334_006533 [Kwoniella shivajii]